MFGKKKKKTVEDINLQEISDSVQTEDSLEEVLEETLPDTGEELTPVLEEAVTEIDLAVEETEAEADLPAEDGETVEDEIYAEVEDKETVEVEPDVFDELAQAALDDTVAPEEENAPVRKKSRRKRKKSGEPKIKKHKSSGKKSKKNVEAEASDNIDVKERTSFLQKIKALIGKLPFFDKDTVPAGVAKDDKLKFPFVARILIITVAPMVLFFVISLLLTRFYIKDTIEKDRQVTLKTAVSAVKSSYDYAYEGDYILTMANVFCKGDTILSNNQQILDQLKYETGVVSSITYASTRKITSILDDEGSRIVGTSESDAIYEHVRGGEPYYGVVEIEGVTYDGY
ncbi:MAG: cache domain-containing protein, partial [Butyrivibrio sp.]